MKYWLSFTYPRLRSLQQAINLISNRFMVGINPTKKKAVSELVATRLSFKTHPYY
jgi:hypothetical protein